MARGLDKDNKGVKLPPRKNPFGQKIVSLSEDELRQAEEENRLRAEEKHIEQEEKSYKEKALEDIEGQLANLEDWVDVDRWKEKGKSDQEIRQMARGKIFRAKNYELADQLIENFLKAKTQGAENLIEKRREYLISHGLIDDSYGQSGVADNLKDLLNKEKVNGFAGLIEEEYEVEIRETKDEHLKGQGKKFMFRVSYSPDAAFAALYRDRVGDKDWYFPYSSDRVTGYLLSHSSLQSAGKINERIEQIWIEDQKGLNNEGIVASGFASSEEEARRLAKDAVAEKRKTVLENVQKSRDRALERKAEKQRIEDNRALEKRERAKKQAQEEKRIQRTAKRFSGLSWADSNSMMEYITNDTRGLTRKDLSNCSLVTFYEDDGRFSHHSNSIAGAVFHKGELAAIVREDQYGQVILSAPLRRGYFVNEDTIKVLRPAKKNALALNKRKMRRKDPEKIRAEIEKEAEQYINELIEKDALENI